MKLLLQFAWEGFLCCQSMKWSSEANGKKKVFHKGIESSAFSRIKKLYGWVACELKEEISILPGMFCIKLGVFSEQIYPLHWTVVLGGRAVCMLMHVYTHTGVAGLPVYSLNLISFLFWIIDLDICSSSSWQHPALLYLRSGFWGSPQPPIKSILDHGKAHDGPSVLLSLPPDYLCCSATQVRFCFIIADCCC